MDSPQTHNPQPPLPPLPRRRPSTTSIPSASTTPPAQTHRQPLSPSSARGRPRPSRQTSEIVLPEWQPDSSADHCPICRSGFTFWNRRHHCRKCGRVVCHACSPHRITIPKAFVVQPPPSPTCYPPVTVVATGASSTPQRNPHRSSWGPESDGGQLRRASSGGGDEDDDGLEVRICDECLGRRSDGGSNLYPSPQNGRAAHPRYGAPPTPYYSSTSLPSRRPPQQTYYYAVPGASRRGEIPPSFRPSPRLRETDYCPICTLALPPVDPVSGSEELRERHVQVCIRSVSGSEQPVRGRRYTGGGARMVVWRAAEKDCWVVNDEKKQEKAECVICFEEFEEGDVIARLECLCRYHKKCIREWFDRRGNGECPVHAVHD